MTEMVVGPQVVEVPVVMEGEAQLPEYGSSGAAGADVRARLESDKILQPGESTLVPTGLFIAVPEGYELQVRPRSGLAFKNQVTVLNTPGTIDSDYRGEVGVILINHGKSDFTITPGMRIAQVVLAPFVRIQWQPTAQLPSTERAGGGFGHTGTH